MNTSKKFLLAAFCLGFGLLAAQSPIPLKSLQTAVIKTGTEGGKARQMGVTDANGKQRYVAATDVLVTPITYTPPTTGNTINLGRFVERNDTVWYIDFEGDSKRLSRGSGGGGSADQDWLKIRNNQVPYAITDSIWTDNIVSINGRNYFPDVELNVYDSVSTAGATIAAIGNRGGRHASYNTLTGTWSSIGQEGSVAQVYAGNGTTHFSVSEVTGSSPGNPSGTFEQHFELDLVNNNAKFNKYQNSRNDTGKPVNLLSTNSSGGVESHPVSDLKDSLGLLRPSGEVVFGTGSGVSSESAYNYNPLTNKLTADTMQTNIVGLTTNRLRFFNDTTYLSNSSGVFYKSWKDANGGENILSGSKLNTMHPTGQANNIFGGGATGFPNKITAGTLNSIYSGYDNIISGTVANAIHNGMHSFIGATATHANIIGGGYGRIESGDNSVIVEADFDTIQGGNNARLFGSQSRITGANNISVGSISSQIVGSDNFSGYVRNSAVTGSGFNSLSYLRSSNINGAENYVGYAKNSRINASFSAINYGVGDTITASSGYNFMTNCFGCYAEGTATVWSELRGKHAYSGQSGEWVSANGFFTEKGDAQKIEMVLKQVSTSATPVVLVSDVSVSLTTKNLTNFYSLNVPANAVFVYDIDIVGRSDDGTKFGAYNIKGALQNTSGTPTVKESGTVAALGSPIVTTIFETDATWDVSAAVNFARFWDFRCTGSAATNAKWVGSLTITKVKS